MAPKKVAKKRKVAKKVVAPVVSRIELSREGCRVRLTLVEGDKSISFMGDPNAARELAEMLKMLATKAELHPPSPFGSCETTFASALDAVHNYIGRTR